MEHKYYFFNHPVCGKSQINWECRTSSKNTQEAARIVEFLKTHEYSKVCKNEGLQWWHRKSGGFEILWDDDKKVNYIHHVEFGDDKVENILTFVEHGLDDWDRINEEEDKAFGW